MCGKQEPFGDEEERKPRLQRCVFYHGSGVRACPNAALTLKGSSATAHMACLSVQLNYSRQMLNYFTNQHGYFKRHSWRVGPADPLFSLS